MEIDGKETDPGDISKEEEETKHGPLEDEKTPQESLRPFYLYQWLDVCDTEKNWLEAQVIEVQKNSSGDVIKIYIHYKGWKSKYDEWLMVAEEEQEGYDNEKKGDFDRIALIHAHTRPLHAPRHKIDFRPGLELDIKDTRDDWCKGKVQSIQPIRNSAEKMLRISYDGWSAKYDECINSNSYRFAPLYTHTPAPTRFIRMKPPAGVYTATKDEETKFRELLQSKKGWIIRDQGGDGNCLFRTVAHQVYGDPELHLVVREKCMEYIASERLFFQSYVSGPFDEYLKEMKQNGAWGDHVEIQALSEIYDRPIEVYAYSDTPLNTYQGAPTHNQPMRLSYHYRSHYNSIMDPKTFNKSLLTIRAGEIEDLQIKESKRRGGKRAGLTTDSGDSELKLALELSRRDFQTHHASDLDRAIHSSLHEDMKNMSEWDRAVIASLRIRQSTPGETKNGGSSAQLSQLTDMQAALAASIQEQSNRNSVSDIDRAIAASLMDTSMSSHTDTDADLARAIAASVEGSSEPPISDLDRAIAESMEQHRKYQQER